MRNAAAIRSVEKGKSGANASRRMVYASLLGLILAVFLFTPLFWRLDPTGYIVAKRTTTYSQEVGWEINESSDALWLVEHPQEIVHIAVSGSIAKTGSAKIFIEGSDGRYLIFDSSRLEEKGLWIVTGAAVPNESFANETTSNETMLNLSANTGFSNETSIQTNITSANITRVQEDRGSAPTPASVLERTTFSNACIDTCDVAGFNSSSYVLVFEINGTYVHIDGISYSIEREVLNKPPIFAGIPNQTMMMGTNLSLKLSDYALDPDNDSLTFSSYKADNLSVVIEGDLVTLLPEPGFEGTRYIFFIANDSIDVAVSPLVEVSVSRIARQRIEGETFQSSARIGKPVKWVKRIRGEKGRENISTELPRLAGNISVRKVNELTGEERELEIAVQNEREVQEVPAIITGQAVSEDSISGGSGLISRFFASISGANRITGRAVEVVQEQEKENITVNIDGEAVEEEDEFVIEYYTDAPYAEERRIDGRSKEITVIGPDEVGYENVLAFSELPFEVSDERKIKLYHSVDGLKQESEFTAYDNDGDGLYERIEWVVPHLSEQVYEIVIITKAEHLDENKAVVSDIYESVKEQEGIWSEPIPPNHYVRATFEQPLDSAKDITLYARSAGNSSASLEVYTENGEGIIASIGNITAENSYTMPLIGLSESTATVDIKVLDGTIEIDYIVDPSLISVSTATIPRVINIQGKLTNAANAAVSDGTYGFVFTLYNVSSGGTGLWNESHNITTVSGVYDADLGRKTSMNLEFDQSYYLGIKVESDAEMTPRINLTTNPWAFRSFVAYELASTDGWISLKGNVNATQNLTVVENLNVTGNITAAQFIGDGSLLTGISSGGGNTTTEMASALDNTSIVREYQGYFKSEVNLTQLLDDNYRNISSRVGNTTAEIREQFLNSSNVTIRDGVISINETFLRAGDAAGGNTSAEMIDATTGNVNSTSWLKAGTNIILKVFSDFVGIGTSGPSSRLDVNGSVNATQYLINGTDIYNVFTELTDTKGNTTAEIASALDNITILRDYQKHGNTTAEIWEQFGNSSNITIINGIISINASFVDEGHVFGNTSAEIVSAMASEISSLNTSLNNSFRSEDTNLNASMKEYARSEVILLNTSLNNSFRSEDTNLNASAQAYARTEAANLNASVKAYADNADSLLNVSMRSLGFFNSLSNITGYLNISNVKITGIANFSDVNVTGGLYVRDKVGIGTTAPSHTLTVAGTMNVSGNTLILGELNTTGRTNFNDVNISGVFDAGFRIAAPDREAVTQNLWIPRWPDLQYVIMQDYQDELAYADMFADNISVSPAVEGGTSINNIFRDDATWAQFNSGGSPYPIIIDVNLTSNPITAKASSKFNLGLTFRSTAAANPNRISVELYNSSDEWVLATNTTYNSTGSNDVWLSPSLTGLSDTSSGIRGLRVTLYGTNPLPANFLLQRMILYHRTAPWDPWKLHIGGGMMYGGVNFSGVTQDITTPAGEDLALMPGGKVTVVGDLNVTGTSYIYATEGVIQPVYGSDDGLALYLPFNTNETTNQQYDYSPYGNDGLMVGGVVCNSTYGKYGVGCNFYGSGDYIDSGRDLVAELDQVNEFTLLAWIKPANADKFMGIMGTGNPYSADGEGFILDYRGSVAGDPIRFQLNNDSGTATTITVNIGDLSNQWIHVAAVVNRTGNVDVYLNGSRKGGGSIAVNSGGTINSGTGLVVGVYGEALGTADFNGTIDEPMIYKRALSPDEIRTQYLRGIKAHGTLQADEFKIANTTGTLSLKLNQTDFLFSTAGIERFRIDSAGKVGIGTSTPTTKLDVFGQVNSTGYIANASVGFTGSCASTTTITVVGGIITACS